MKNRNRALLVISILLAISLFATACGSTEDPAATTTTTLTTQTTVSTTLDDDITVASDDTTVSVKVGDALMVSGEDLDWPADTLPGLPEPDGKIQVILTDDDQETVSVTIGDMNSSESESYVAALKSAGFDTDVEAAIPDDGYMFTGTNSQGTVVYSYDGAEEMAVLIFTVIDLGT